MAALLLLVEAMNVLLMDEYEGLLLQDILLDAAHALYERLFAIS